MTDGGVLRLISERADQEASSLSGHRVDNSSEMLKFLMACCSRTASLST